MRSSTSNFPISFDVSRDLISIYSSVLLHRKHMWSISLVIRYSRDIPDTWHWFRIFPSQGRIKPITASHGWSDINIRWRMYKKSHRCSAVFSLSRCHEWSGEQSSLWYIQRTYINSEGFFAAELHLKNLYCGYLSTQQQLPQAWYLLVSIYDH